jgi:hypothetical protein
MTTRRAEVGRRRRDRRAQVAVVVLAVGAGVVAGLLGTHKVWERDPAPPAATTTTVAPSSIGANGGLP